MREAVAYAKMCLCYNAANGKSNNTIMKFEFFNFNFGEICIPTGNEMFLKLTQQQTRGLENEALEFRTNTYASSSSQTQVSTG